MSDAFDEGPEPVPHAAQRLAWRLMGAAFAALATVLVVRLLPASAPVRVEPPAPPAPTVRAWEGVLPEALGGGLARLRPLHADPERQAFDAAALGRELGREGSPWRLELEGIASAEARVELRGGTLVPVEPGPGPLRQLLARTIETGARVLFGPGEPETVALVIDDVRLELEATELAVPVEEEALLREELE